MFICACMHHAFHTLLMKLYRTISLVLMTSGPIVGFSGSFHFHPENITLDSSEVVLSKQH